MDEFKSFSENCENEKDEFNDDKLNKILDCTENDLKLENSEKNNLYDDRLFLIKKSINTEKIITNKNGTINENKNVSAIPSINDKVDQNNVLKDQNGEVILKFDNSKRDKRIKRLSKESIMTFNNEKDVQEVNQSLKN